MYVLVNERKSYSRVSMTGARSRYFKSMAMVGRIVTFLNLILYIFILRFFFNDCLTVTVLRFVRISS